jgi:hypothetical protein
MKREEFSSIILASKELGTSFTETSVLISNTASDLSVARNLWGNGRGGSISPLVKFGLALIAFPDPTISDLVGGCIVCAGLVYSKIKPPPIYVEDVYSTVEKEMGELVTAFEISP